MNKLTLNHPIMRPYPIFVKFTVLAFLIAMSACKKSPTNTAEEPLKVSTDAETYAVVPAPDYTFNVKVESSMPARGVQIIYELKGEDDNQDYPQGPAIFTNNKTTSIRIVNLPRQKVCVCTVYVNSMSTLSNTTKLTFRVGYK